MANGRFGFGSGFYLVRPRAADVRRDTSPPRHPREPPPVLRQGGLRDALEEDEPDDNVGWDWPDDPPLPRAPVPAAPHDPAHALGHHLDDFDRAHDEHYVVRGPAGGIGALRSEGLGVAPTRRAPPAPAVAMEKLPPKNKHRTIHAWAEARSRIPVFGPTPVFWTIFVPQAVRDRPFSVPIDLGHGSLESHDQGRSNGPSLRSIRAD